MTKRPPLIGPGYYRRDDRTSRLQPVGDVDEAPTVVICRRVRDYAPAPVPAGAGVTPCSRCGSFIAFNPAGLHQDVPKVCMQCAGIRPLPIDPPS